MCDGWLKWMEISWRFHGDLEIWGFEWMGWMGGVFLIFIFFFLSENAEKVSWKLEGDGEEPTDQHSMLTNYIMYG